MRTSRPTSPPTIAKRQVPGFSNPPSLLRSICRRVNSMANYLHLWVAAAFVFAAASSQAAITGQWSFESGDVFGSAKVGQDIEYLEFQNTPFDTEFNTTTAFGIADIGGQSVPVMKFPKTA